MIAINLPNTDVIFFTRNTFLKNSKEPYVAGEFIKRPILARTLQIIASRGKKALYCHGKLHGGFLKDLKAAGKKSFTSIQ